MSVHHGGKAVETLAFASLTACFFVSAISVSLTVATYLLAFILVLLSGDWRTRWERIKKNRAALSFWLLGSLFIVGIFYSTSTANCIIQDLKKNHWLFITPFFIAFLTKEEWRRRMITAFLSAMIFILFLSYIQYIFHVQFSDYLRVMRRQSDVSAVFVDHIVQGFAMNIAAFICGYRFLFSSKKHYFYGILFVLMAINILWMSEGRVGYGIFFLLLVFLSFLRFRWKGFLCACIAGSVLISIPFFLSHQFKSHIEVIDRQYHSYDSYHAGDKLPQNESVYVRIEMWHIAERMISERPWFGYGTGGIRTALPLVVPAQDRIYKPSVDYVESLYLNMLLEFGIVGFSVFIFAIAMQIKMSFYLPREYRALMQAVLIAVLFGGLFNGFFVSFSVAHLYALFSALCFSAWPYIADTC